MSDQWFYAKAGQSIGPVAIETLRGHLASGEIQPGDFVWRAGMAQWAPAGTVSELSGGSVATAVSASPSPGVRPLEYQRFLPDEGGIIYAGFWKRFCAAFLDGIITSVGGAIAGGVAGAVIGGLMGGSGASITQIQAVAEGMGQVMGILVGWLYAALMESSTKQATLGKMAMGIVVTDLQGQRISFGRATGRHFGKIVSALILLIGYIMVAFTERKQALHDIMAGCLVVRRR